MCQTSAIDLNYMNMSKKVLKGKNEEQSIIGVDVNVGISQLSERFTLYKYAFDKIASSHDSAYFHLLPVSFNLT